MAKFSRAMVFYGTGEPLQLCSYRLPRLAEGELLVRITCCTLCGSDIHTYEGRRATPCPSVLGNEITGRVAQLPRGSAVCDQEGTPLEIGDRVTWTVAASCGSCFFCVDGLPQKCERLFKYGRQQISDRRPLSGGLAEFRHLSRGTAVFRVRAELSDVVACPANCATAPVGTPLPRLACVWIAAHSTADC
jgi:alcohol dehydrogenase